MKKKFSIVTIIMLIAFYNIASAQSWKLTGNAGTSPASNFLGTTDAKPIIFKTNNKARMRISNTGKIGIGTDTPAFALHVFGAMQIENNNTINYDDPLLILRNKSANGTVTNPVIAFKGEDTLFASLGYDFSTRDFVISAQPSLYAPNLIINHDNGFTGLNNKTPKAQLDINSDVGRDALRVQIDSSTKLYVNDRGGVSIGTSTAGPSNGLYVSGSTGLGISAPLYKLDVTGTSRFTGNVGIQTVPNSRTLQVGINQGSLVGIGSSEYIQDAGASFLSTNSSWLPVTDNLYSLGNTSFRWKDVWAVDGTINTSDARDKTNIRDLNYGLKEIMQLHAVKFNWKNNPDEGDKLGVIAQEIKKVLPEVVRDWDYKILDEASGKQVRVPAEHLGVMYADIIPVLIKSIQELSKNNDALEKSYATKINELQKQIDELKNISAHSNASAKIETIKNNFSLKNIPNPVKNSTAIYYNIANSKNAQLNITNAEGKIIKQIQLGVNSNSVNVDCAAFSPGTYYYTLIIDNAAAASNKMVVVK